MRDAEGNWPRALAPEQLRQAIYDNLDHLGLEVLDVVNLRVGGFDRPEPGSIAEPFSVLAELQHGGLIKHLGLSTVNTEQIAEAQSSAPILCVQNFYNVANRADDDLIDALIAYVPYFPLGGSSPLQSDRLRSVAARLELEEAISGTFDFTPAGRNSWPSTLKQSSAPALCNHQYLLTQDSVVHRHFPWS